ncbi:MAG: hypothetical protein SXA11_21065 [Cyanobacteriota bacterium]|nr:hypothetical protein [Cyanobacteriota bacterium]
MDIQNQARSLMTRHHGAVKNRQQSMLGRAGASVGIEPDNYWSQVQGKPKSSFRQTYDRSGASMS